MPKAAQRSRKRPVVVTVECPCRRCGFAPVTATSTPQGILLGDCPQAGQTRLYSPEDASTSLVCTECGDVLGWCNRAIGALALPSAQGIDQ